MAIQYGSVELTAEISNENKEIDIKAIEKYLNDNSSYSDCFSKISVEMIDDDELGISIEIENDIEIEPGEEASWDSPGYPAVFLDMIENINDVKDDIQSCLEKYGIKLTENLSIEDYSLESEQDISLRMEQEERDAYESYLADEADRQWKERYEERDY
jgi:hypothetical protein